MDDGQYGCDERTGFVRCDGASAIAALQEASGRSSRASTQSAYRAYARLIRMVIERIRQFYDLPRRFRIVGAGGAEEFVSYCNARLKAQSMGPEALMRMPVFDVSVAAQKHTAYTKLAQNELALQFFQLGFSGRRWRRRRWRASI